MLARASRSRSTPRQYADADEHNPLQRANCFARRQDQSTQQGIASGDFGEATLHVPIPECAKAGSYAVVCSAQSGNVKSSDSFPIQIGPGSSCAPSGGTNATIFEMQDVIKGSETGAAFPIVIRNDDTVQRTYILGVDGIAPWGDYVFEEGGVVVVPAGQTKTTALRVYANDDATPAIYPFKVTIKSGDQSDEQLLSANVEPATVLPGAQSGISAMMLFWIILIVVIFGVLIVLAWRAAKENK